MALAEKHNLLVVNDAAEAFGAMYKGRQIAEIAHITSYSTENPSTSRRARAALS